MENKKLVEMLYLCSAQCTNCLDACNGEKDKEKVKRWSLLEDCSDICELTGQWIDRNAISAPKGLELCAEICLECAAECDRHHHAHCKRCAAVCRSCAEMCRDAVALT